MSHGSDDSDNYWPGYVDALTSMVQVLAFVMMMLAMAVFVLSQSVTKNAVEAIAKAVNADVKPDSDIKQMTQAVMDQLERLKPASASSKTQTPEPPAEAPPSKPAAAASTSTSNPEAIVSLRVSGDRGRLEQAPPQVAPNAPHLTVNFEDRSFKLDTDRAQSVANFVADNKLSEKQQTVVITAYAFSGDGALSEARRLAYYRAMMARKQLVDGKVRADAIRINVNDTTDKEKGSTVEMVVAR